jgi:hypothetical protein
MKTEELDTPVAPDDGPAPGMMSNGYVIRLLPIDMLLPHEEHDHEHAVALSRAIAKDGYLSRPVVVEERTLTLLDGHHRLAALAMLGCRFVPSVLLDYEDPRVRLDGWRPDVVVDRDMVIAAASRGQLLPVKTTRHQLSPELDQIRINIALLNSDQSHGY